MIVCPSCGRGVCLVSCDEVRLGRAFINALRECLGFDPLIYLPPRKAP